VIIWIVISKSKYYQICVLHFAFLFCSGDLAINSIELAELILRCEEEFGIDIQEEEMHKFVTVGDVVEYLNTLEK
jgi:acyl carrier protein